MLKRAYRALSIRECSFNAFLSAGNTVSWCLFAGVTGKGTPGQHRKLRLFTYCRLRAFIVLCSIDTAY
jgi:hypothetical protein